MEKNEPFIRMICAVKPKNIGSHKEYGLIAQNLIQIPSNLFEDSCISVEKLQEIEDINNKTGVSRALIPDNCKYVIGNTKKENGNIYTPMCAIYTAGSISSNFTEKIQCETLNSTNPVEFKKKWIAIGCPYHVNTEHVKNLGLKNTDEILTFKEIKFPEYDILVNKHMGVLNAPFTIKEFNEIMKA